MLKEYDNKFLQKAFRLFVKGFASIKGRGLNKTVKKVFAYIYKRRPLSLSEIKNLFYESEYQENIDFSKYTPKVKTIAFYLPQFHAILENDLWWGKNFTEWTNTCKVDPRFNGHYQPREPHDDFGYYDLTDIEIIKKQVLLAKQHGIYGFCFYLYWFSGKRLLEKPLDLFLEYPEIDINFCLCWANENWTRTWDGYDKEILIKQNYSEEDPNKFIDDIKKYVTDKRYIKIDGEPVILVYNPGRIPNVNNVFNIWREKAINSGIGKIKIWICRTFEHTAKSLNIVNNVDGEVEFPPHGLPTIHKEKIIKIKGNTGTIYDYKEIVNKINCIIDRIDSDDSNMNLPLYRTSMLGWDNSARRTSGWAAYAGYSLRFFYIWVRAIINETKRKYNEDSSFIFINAWNEWAEGTYLEPDKKYGYANINTLSKAIYNLPFYIGKPIIQRKYEKINNKLLNMDDIKICVQVHLYDIELIDEIIMNLNYIPFPFHCYISTDTDEKLNIINNEFTQNCKNAHKVYVKRFDNRGRDVAPFIEQMENEIDKYEFLLHIHSKKSRENDEYRDNWREYLFKHLLGNTKNIYNIFLEFMKNKKIGLIFPDTYLPIESWIVWGTDEEQGKNNVIDLLKRIDIKMNLGNNPKFAAGNMFWARTKAIKKVFAAGIRQNDFPCEEDQKDMTLAHAIERSWVYIAQHEGYTFKQMNSKLI